MSAAPASRDADPLGARLATRITFCVAGFAVSCWAPLVPFAQARLAVDNAVLGLLLLCLGLGSVSAMVFTGSLSARQGARPLMLAGCGGVILLLPALAVAASPAALGAALFAFGACMGTLDVAMNIHAVEVERAARRPLMSGFHGMYSLGGFSGSMLMTLLLSLRLSPATSTLLCAAMMGIATLIAAPRIMRHTAAQAGTHSVVPRGVVLLLAMLAGVTFLSEGAVLDWGALLMTRAGLLSAAQGGLGYVLFSIAMTVGRLTGDGIVARVGDRSVLVGGSLLAMSGYVLVVSVPITAVALGGFLCIGLGASNIVPVLFRGAGTQTSMPPGLAVAAISTVGYAGVLLGPAAIGLLAQVLGLHVAFGLLAVLLLLVTFSARAVSPPPRVSNAP